MALTDGGARAGANGKAQWTEGTLRYEVAAGDVPDVIAARFSIDVMRLINTDGLSVQPVPFSDAIWPIAAGEEPWISTQDLLELMTTRIFYPTDDPSNAQEYSGERPELPEEGFAGDLQLPQGNWPDQVELPAAHPVFRRWFADDLYEDEADELAPFGSDEGADALAQVRDLLHPDEPMPFLTLLASADGPVAKGELEETDPDSTRESDPVLIGLALALLRITGTMDKQGCDVLVQALRRQVGRFGEAPRLMTMLRDVDVYRRGAGV